MSLGRTFLSGANIIASAINTTSIRDKINVIAQLGLCGIALYTIKKEAGRQRIQLEDQILQKRLFFERSDIDQSYCKGKCIKEYFNGSSTGIPTVNVGSTVDIIVYKAQCYGDYIWKTRIGGGLGPENTIKKLLINHIEQHFKLIF